MPKESTLLEPGKWIEEFMCKEKLLLPDGNPSYVYAKILEQMLVYDEQTIQNYFQVQ